MCVLFFIRLGLIVFEEARRVRAATKGLGMKENNKPPPYFQFN